MSVVTTETIYVFLKNEGTDAWRPVEAKKVAQMVYQNVTENPAESLEEQEFPSGTKVRCIKSSSLGAKSN